jgi:hypothetical protein
MLICFGFELVLQVRVFCWFCGFGGGCPCVSPSEFSSPPNGRVAQAVFKIGNKSGRTIAAEKDPVRKLRGNFIRVLLKKYSRNNGNTLFVFEKREPLFCMLRRECFSQWAAFQNKGLWGKWAGPS